MSRLLAIVPWLACVAGQHPAPRDGLAMAVVGKTHNVRQESPGTGGLRDLNFHFFAEIFVVDGAPASLVQGARLSGPGRARAPAAFPSSGVDREVHGGRWTDGRAREELEAAYPDDTYTIWYNTTAGDLAEQALPHAGAAFPDAPTLTLIQGGSEVSEVDPSLDLEVRWTAFSAGGLDPNGVCPDLIFFEVWDCWGVGVVHSGDPFVTPEFLTYANDSFSLPAGTLEAGRVYQVSVEHSKLVTAAPADPLPPALGTWAATTFLDFQTAGQAPAGSRKCPAVPWQGDPGQTDRSTPPLSKRCEDEVLRLHAFFEDWWNGRVEKDTEIFGANFTNRTDLRFEFVSPTGLPSDRQSTADFIFSQWGTRYESSWAKPDWAGDAEMRIVITNVTTAWSDEDACAAAAHFQEHSQAGAACSVLFHENQQVGGDDGPTQAKANGATLRCDERGNLVWLLEQETWWPGFTEGQDACGSLDSLPAAAVPACHGCARCLPGTCGDCLQPSALV